MTKKTCFAFIVWKDRETAQNYYEPDNIHYVIHSEPGKTYTMQGLWDYWRVKVKGK